MNHILVESSEQLRRLLRPIVDGRIREFALDTETSEIIDGRFTPYGTESRVAGFSFSYDLDGQPIDVYVPVRHRPYDFRRNPALIIGDTINDGASWLRRLTEVEGVTPPCEGSGYPGGEWDDGADPNLDPITAFEALQEALHAPDVSIFVHNVLFDAAMLDVEGIDLPWNRLHCTQALSVYTDERPLDAFDEQANAYVHGGHGLKHLGEVYLHIRPDAEALLDQAKQALGKGSAKLEDYSMLPLRTAVAPYAALDTRLTLQLARLMRERPAYKLDAVRKLLAYHRAEAPILIDIMRAGMTVDVEPATRRAEECRKQRAELIAEMKKLAGRDVPVDSPIRLREVLYSDLEIPRFRGNDDTRAATLKHVRTKLVSEGQTTINRRSVDDLVRLLDSIAAYRSVDKELVSFFGPLADSGGVVHPVIRQLGAATTRMTVEKPNIHQMPRPDSTCPEKSVRHLFKPAPGHVFVCADYSAQEMRLAAHYTAAIPEAFAYRFTWRCTQPRRGSCKGRAPHGPGETHVGYRETYSARPDVLHLLDGFVREGTSFDPHARMVEIVKQRGYDLPRSKCKAANFAILYGCGGPKLADLLDVPVDVAYALIRLFWDEVYPELGRVKIFVSERLRQIGASTKFSHEKSIRTLNGAPIYLSDGYKGLNYVIQRSGREIVLRAVVECAKYIRENALPYRIAMVIHDEIIFEIPEANLDEKHVRALCRIMVEAGEPSRVAMVVEPSIARESWAIKEKLPEAWGWNGVTAD